MIQNSSMAQGKIWLQRSIMGLMVWWLCACTVVRLGYNHGEWLSYWWLDRYVDVTSTQRPWVQARIQNLWSWHRKTQLHDYIQLLALAQKQLQGEVTQAQLLADFMEAKKRVLIVIEKALPDVADLALSVTPEQLQSLQNKFEQDNEEYYNDYVKGTAVQRRQFRYEKMLSRAEFWFGNFSRAQKEQLRRASDARILNQSLHWVEAMQRQKNLMMILKKIQTEKPDREVARSWLREHVATYYEYTGSPERKVFFDGYVDESVRLMVRVIQLTTPEQKAHAAKKLQNWMDDFETLARQTDG